MMNTEKESKKDWKSPVDNHGLRRRWTPEMDVILRRMNEECKTYEEMGLVLGRSAQAILCRRHILGLKYPKRRQRRQGWSVEKRELLAQLVEKGLSQKEIASRIGQTTGSIAVQMWRQRISYTLPLYEIETPGGFRYQTRELSTFVQKNYSLFGIAKGLTKEEVKYTPQMCGIYKALRTQRPWKGMHVRILEDGNYPSRRKKDGAIEAH